MFIESSRIGVFRALIDRVAALHAQEESVLDVRVSPTQLTSISETSFIIYRQCILVAFEISNEDDRKLVVPCILRLLDRKSTRLNSSHSGESRMPSSA